MQPTSPPDKSAVLTPRHERHLVHEAACAAREGRTLVLAGAGLGLALDAFFEAGGSRAVLVEERAAPGAGGGGTDASGQGRDGGEEPWRALAARHPGLELVLARDQAEAAARLAALPGLKEALLLVHPVRLRQSPAFFREFGRALDRARARDEAGGASLGPVAREPRVLVLTTKFFLCGELLEAAARLDAPAAYLDLGQESRDVDEFLDLLDRALSEHRPDVVLTINHLGFDRQGLALEVLRRRGILAASWFVDSPELTMPSYRHPDPSSLVVLCYDADGLPWLKEQGFEKSFWVPLGADERRFHPGRVGEGAKPLAQVAFVGNSMAEKSRRRLAAARPGEGLARAFGDIAAGFAASRMREVGEYVAARHSDLAAEYAELAADTERRMAFLAAVIWEATGGYRAECLRALLPLRPLVVGDPGWLDILPPEGFAYHPEMTYYTDLPLFYPRVAVNFNATNKQMKGAVNQRVFDVPASGAFLLTDDQAQLAELFNPDEEMAVYRRVKDIPELAARYLADKDARERMAHKARRRLLAHHTYVHRYRRMLGLFAQCGVGRAWV